MEKEIVTILFWGLIAFNIGLIIKIKNRRKQK